MTEPRDDRQLERLFRSLRHEDAAATPPFVAPQAPARPWFARPPLVASAALAAAVVLVVTSRLIRDDLPSRVGLIDLASTRWIAPTDFLLQTPGIEQLREVPRLSAPRPADPDRNDSERGKES